MSQVEVLGWEPESPGELGGARRALERVQRLRVVLETAKKSNLGPREHGLQAALLQTRTLETDFIGDTNPKERFREKGVTVNAALKSTAHPPNF